MTDQPIGGGWVESYLVELYPFSATRLRRYRPGKQDYGNLESIRCP